MPTRALSSSLLGMMGLCLGAATAAGCHNYEILRYSEQPERPWDVAWLVPLDAQGRVVQPVRRFEADVAGGDLSAEAAGYLIVGLVIDALPPQHRKRIDTASLAEAELIARADRSAEWTRLSDGVYASPDRTRMELDLDPKAAHFDLVGPRSFDPDDVLSSSTAFALAADVPVRANYCDPITAELRTPSLATTSLDLARVFAELHVLSGERLVGAVQPVFSAEQRAALVRFEGNGRITDDDVLTLPAPTLPGTMNEGVRELLIRSRSQSPDHVSAFALRIDGKQPHSIQLGHLYLLELPREASWEGLSIDEVDANGPLAGEFTQSPLSVAESHLGDVLVLGGRNDGTGMTLTPHGYVMVSPGSSSTLSFALHDVIVSGSINGDILMRAVALPPDPNRPTRSTFAIGSRRGEILIAAYDAAEPGLVELDRYVPPPDITVKVGAGYQFMHVFDRTGGYELWAVGNQSLLVRRTVDGRWQSMTNIIRDNSLADESARPCMPVGYPRGREISNVARHGNTALITLKDCSGAMLLRFDRDDEPLCASAVWAPGEGELRADANEDFDAVTAVNTGYYMVRRNRFELMHVAVED